jgi:hypothetical protein
MSTSLRSQCIMTAPCSRSGDEMLFVRQNQCLDVLPHEDNCSLSETVVI